MKTATPTLVLNTCCHCGRYLSMPQTLKINVACVVTTYSKGCLCRLSLETLERLLAGDDAALSFYRRFRREWYLSVGTSEENARRNTVNITFPLTGDLKWFIAQKRFRGEN